MGANEVLGKNAVAHNYMVVVWLDFKHRLTPDTEPMTDQSSSSTKVHFVELISLLGLLTGTRMTQRQLCP